MLVNTGVTFPVFPSVHKMSSTLNNFLIFILIIGIVAAIDEPQNSILYFLIGIILVWMIARFFYGKTILRLLEEFLQAPEVHLNPELGERVALLRADLRRDPRERGALRRDAGRGPQDDRVVRECEVGLRLDQRVFQGVRRNQPA